MKFPLGLQHMHVVRAAATFQVPTGPPSAAAYETHSQDSSSAGGGPACRAAADARPYGAAALEAQEGRVAATRGVGGVAPGP